MLTTDFLDIIFSSQQTFFQLSYRRFVDQPTMQQYTSSEKK